MIVVFAGVFTCKCFSLTLTDLIYLIVPSVVYVFQLQDPALAIETEREVPNILSLAKFRVFGSLSYILENHLKNLMTFKEEKRANFLKV